MPRRQVFYSIPQEEIDRLPPGTHKVEMTVIVEEGPSVFDRLGGLDIQDKPTMVLEEDLLDLRPGELLTMSETPMTAEEQRNLTHQEATALLASLKTPPPARLRLKPGSPTSPQELMRKKSRMRTQSPSPLVISTPPSAFTVTVVNDVQAQCQGQASAGERKPVTAEASAAEASAAEASAAEASAAGTLDPIQSWTPSESRGRST